MSVDRLVERFYEELWNAGNLDVANEILHPEVTFRGSVGQGARGRREVCEYVSMVTTALSNYRCDVLDLISSENRAAGKVRFSGVHSGEFLGYAPTARPIQWIGAAFFTETDELLSEVWVLGDLVALHEQLRSEG